MHRKPVSYVHNSCILFIYVVRFKQIALTCVPVWCAVSFVCINESADAVLLIVDRQISDKRVCFFVCACI